MAMDSTYPMSMFTATDYQVVPSRPKVIEIREVKHPFWLRTGRGTIAIPEGSVARKGHRG